MTIIIFDTTAIAALTLLGRAVSACRHMDLLKNQFDFSENVASVAEWLKRKVDECENTISAEELNLDGYDLENDVNFS